MMYQMGHNLNWFGHGANTAKVVGSIPVQAIHLRVGLKILVGSFWPCEFSFPEAAKHSFLFICGFCQPQMKLKKHVNIFIANK